MSNRLFTHVVICLMIGLSTASKWANASVHKTVYFKYRNTDTVTITNMPFLGFYTKYLNCEGIAIRSGNVVSNKALYIAASKLRLMLANMDSARKNLIGAGAELHIIGKDQQPSDLPELADQKGMNYIDHGTVTDIDKRTRGVGGLYASCGEENLLQLPADRYAGGWDICIHEFAHTIMNYGLDEQLQQKIHQQYKLSIAAGLWKGAYAESNPQEYWAELSMWYFGAHGNFVDGVHTPVPGRIGLANYDNGGYMLLDSIYKGLLQPSAQHISVQVMKGAVSGTSTEKSVIRVTNSRSSAVKLYWVDQNGNNKLYASVSAKSNLVQATFVSSVWMVADEHDAPLLYVRVNDPSCDIGINEIPKKDSTLFREAATRVSSKMVSGQSTENAAFSIVNNRRESISLYWIDWSGNIQLYNTIVPNAQVQLTTFVSHLWMVKTQSGKLLGYARISAPVCLLTVNNKGLVLKPGKN